jgi:pyruvate dehydrogenase E2 component (dihydrolipoamide acetyltransferase)
MPRQGNTVESCIITNWKVKEGDTVTAETVVCEVETDKAAFEVPAGAAGTVLKLLFAAGDDVPVLRPIAVIGAAGEDWQVMLGNGELGSVNKEVRSDNPVPDTSNAKLPLPIPHSPPPTPQSPISPRARNLAEKEALPLGAAHGSGPGGRIIERDVMAALKDKPPLTAAAKAAGSASSLSIGSGIGGRVTAADVAASPLPEATLSPPHSPLPNEGTITETPIKGIRKIIADRMTASLAQSAQFTLNASAPASKLQEFRLGVKSQGDLAEELGLSKVTINDLILFAVARTLPRFPYMNAHKIGETIKTFERVHLAVAVDTPRGLMVPVIRNANLLSLARISSEAKRLATACQNGSANPDELSGSTFTVSNLGSFGITSFTPVLNAPEVAILGVCGIELKPVALGDAGAGSSAVRFEPQIGFSLTINHQAVDGAPAARFLKALGEAVAHIDLLLAAG